MAFEFIRSENDASQIEKEVPATASAAYVHGSTLALDATTGTAKVNTTAPEFVYVGKDVTAKAGDKLAVVPIQDGYEFETTFSADASALKAGAKVTLSSAGTQATATTTSGIFQLLEDGKASGGKAVGRFVL